MTLKNRDAYKALEDIVTTENISEHPAILDSYAYQWGAELFTNTPYLPWCSRGTPGRFRVL